MAGEQRRPIGARRITSSRSLRDGDDAVARARALGPALAARAEQANALRRIPDETMTDLHESGLLSILTPERFGGSALGPEALFAAAVEIARACGSTGWTYGVLSGHIGLIAGFPDETQEEVLGDPDVVIASLLRLGSEPLVRVDGGYQLTEGSGRFCSGVDHSNWIIVRCNVAGEEDRLRWFLLPRSSYEIVDDWYTVGLLGTGSKSLTVGPTFIPDRHSVPVGDSAHPGSLMLGPAFSLCGAAIGCAYAALDLYREAIAKARGAENPVNLIRLAKASAELDAAYLMVLDARGDQLDAPSVSPLPRGRARRNIAYAVHRARDVVNELFAASGGSAIYSSARMQQVWRDANAASAHGFLSWEEAAQSFGRQFAEGPGVPPRA